MTTTTQQTDDSTDNPALARIGPWQHDPRWGVISGVTPPRNVVKLAPPPELAPLVAAAAADRRRMQAEVEQAHATRIRVARATFDSGDSTKKDLAAAVHEADAERLAREDRLEQQFGPYTPAALLAEVTQAAQAANEASSRESIAQWQKSA
jgi:hypothetical protein